MNTTTAKTTETTRHVSAQSHGNGMDRVTVNFNATSTPRRSLFVREFEPQEMIENGKAEVSIVTATPEFVDPLLERNTKNRAISRQRVASLVGDLKSGNWLFNGAPIVIDADGELRDGQHRLTAIKEAGYPKVQLLVVRLAVGGDESERVFRTIDTGRPRTMANAVAHVGMKYSSSVAAICRVVVMLCKGSSHIPTHAEMFDTLEFLKDSIMTYAPFCKHQTYDLVSIQASCCAAFALMDRFTGEREEILNFVRQVKSGRDLATDSAAYRLFAFMHGRRKEHVSTLSQVERFCATARAVRHHLVCRDKPIKHLRGNDEKLTKAMIRSFRVNGMRLPCDNAVDVADEAMAKAN